VQTILKEDLNMRKLCAKIVWKFWLRSKNNYVLLVAKTGWRMKRVPISCKGW
jgi:hypothetical protein